VAYVPMNRLHIAQSIANEHGWGRVRSVRLSDAAPDEVVEVWLMEGGFRLLDGLLAHEVIRAPEEVPAKHTLLGTKYEV
jgi:hypothetical protein